MDAHAPYRFARLDGQHPHVRRIEYPMIGMSATEAEAEDVRARYDAGVRRSDEQLGRLVAALRARGRPYLAIVTADHGESLGELGRWFHGTSLAPELIGVPLLVLGSGTQPGHVAPPATNRDVRHTVLAAAGLGCTDCQGSDLRTGVGGSVDGGLPPHLAYRVVDRFKLVLDHRSGAQQLFDLAADPQERFDLRAKHPEVPRRSPKA